ncbi:uncharacterized protein LOC141601329 [Silene latifolia]|uniref:uncharacterized protein LOC141601329 n=1 Tax=Silene latifolia TaxID=37657 RepID=UPI003D76AC30
MVDATEGHEMLTFLDAWSGNNQIKMHPSDQEKTIFRSERGSTYQRLVNMMFKVQIGQTMEVYTDDMDVKSKQASQHHEHLADTFSTLRKYEMKMNPIKCTFGASSRKFLVTEAAVSAVLVREQEGSQHPLYYVSKSLLPAETGQGHQDVGIPRRSKGVDPQEAKVLCSTISEEDTPDWRKPYMDCLENDILPVDKKEVRSFRMKASRFILTDGVLFWKSLAAPYLRCLDREEFQADLHALHTGECGNHAWGRSLSNKALRQGYLWPTMRKDVVEFTKKCDACQRHVHVSYQPAEPLHPVISPWPFMKWGMDIMGPFPKAPGNKVYMLAMTDYFFKWIEAESSSHVTETQVISFIKHNIICRWKISLQKSTLRNPQSNGQVESSNKIIVENLKNKLEERGGMWAEEMPLVL